jgi:hypothetical protein
MLRTVSRSYKLRALNEMSQRHSADGLSGIGDSTRIYTVLYASGNLLIVGVEGANFFH